MNSIKVSIIVPAYNREKEIAGCIKSLINQTLKEIEIIVIDDGSTDNTSEAVKAFDDARIKLIKTENRGQGLARNTGISIAKGEYIGFVDSDDDVSPVMYEKMYEKAIEFNADMVQCCTSFIKSSGTSIKPKLENEFVDIIDSFEYVKAFYCTSKHANGPCNKILSAQFLRETGLQFPDSKVFYCEDLMFNLYLLEKLKRVYFMKDAFYNYNISEEGHFLREPEIKLLKTCDLYEQVLKTINDKRIKKAIKSIAADHILTFVTRVLDTQTATDVLKKPILKDYLINMMLFEKTIRHTLFSVVLIVAPVKLKKFILKKVYTRFLSD